MKRTRLSAAFATSVMGFCVFLVFLGGCGPRSPSKRPEVAQAAPASDVAPQVTAEQLTAPEGELKFAAIELMKDGEIGLALSADGTIDVPGKGATGRLTRDGRFLDIHGNTLIELKPEGELVLSNGDYLPVTIDKDGAVHLLKEARVVRLRDDGSLEGANPSGPVVRVEGAAPSTRRTAMLLLVLASYPVLSHP